MGQRVPENFASLESELEIWRKTTFDRIAARRVPLPVLTKLAAKSLDDKNAVQAASNVRQFLSLVVSSVEHNEALSVKHVEAEGAVSSPSVLKEIFGLTIESRNASVQQRQENAGRAIGRGVSWHTMRKHRAAHVQQLAAWIVGYDQNGPQADPHDSVPGIPHMNVMRRPDELGWLTAMYKQLAPTGGFFLLYGVTGMGKTELALRFANQVAPWSNIGYVRFGRRGLFEEDVRRILQVEGYDPSAWSVEHSRAVFRRVVSGKMTMRLLVFDGVTDLEEVNALVPSGSPTPILLTARERLQAVDGQGAYIPAGQSKLLGRLRSEEADRFLTERLPGLESATRADLRDYLGGHPEAIDRVSLYLALEDAIPAEQLLEDMVRAPIRTLHGLGEVLEAPSGLRLAMEQLINRLDPNSLAFDMLTCLIWPDDAAQTNRKFLEQLLSELRREELSSLAIDAALHQLERLGLIHTITATHGTSRLACQIDREVLIETYEPTLLALERLLSVPPLQKKDHSLLEVLRREWAATKRLALALSEYTHNGATPAPRIACLDERDWVLYATDSSGRRRANLYRLTSKTIVRLRSPDFAWRTVSDEEESVILQLVKWYAALVTMHHSKPVSPEQRKLADKEVEHLAAFEEAIIKAERAW